MPKYEVEFANFKTVTIEADSKEEANDKAAIMEDDDIEYKCHTDSGYEIWNEARLIED